MPPFPVLELVGARGAASGKLQKGQFDNNQKNGANSVHMVLNYETGSIIMTYLIINKRVLAVESRKITITRQTWG